MLRYVVLMFFVQYCRGFDVPAGKYIVLLDSPIYPAGEESSKYIDTSEVSVERYNESVALMYGNMIFKQGLDEGTVMEICLLKEASGKQEMIFSHDICDFCEEVGDPESNYSKYFKYFGIPDKCPFEAFDVFCASDEDDDTRLSSLLVTTDVCNPSETEGSYPIHNFSLDTDDFDINSQHAGRYEAQMKIYKKTGDHCQNDRVLQFCLIVDVIIEPEDS